MHWRLITYFCLVSSLVGLSSNLSLNCPSKSALCFENLKGGFANPDAKRLYDDLLANGYNRLIRPVHNNTERVSVWLGLRLSQLIEVNLKSQVMTTNLWVEQKWFDYRLTWDPAEYGGVQMLYMPSENLWLPDIVLYNNADGNYEVTLMTKATVFYTGEVQWNPPAIYKSSCEMDVEWFPFDKQSCLMKFGSWTYDGFQIDLHHIKQTPDSNVVPVGIDLSEFYLSVEWDILEVPAHKNEEYLPCCEEPFPDITFNITMRRKTLFYTVNLIIPCVGITFLTILVFYLPSDSGEKVSLCVNILVSLTVFFLLLAEIIPPTSLAVPLLGKYLLFTMILVTVSICVTVFVLNVHFRSPATHHMPPWVKRVFTEIMPRVLLIRRPAYSCKGKCGGEKKRKSFYNGLDYRYRDVFRDRDLYGEPMSPSDFPASFEPRSFVYSSYMSHESQQPLFPTIGSLTYGDDGEIPDNIRSALRGVLFIAQHIKSADEDQEVIEDWKFVAMVLDRTFLWIFTLACLIGTAAIICQAPSLYDSTVPIDAQLSLIGYNTYSVKPANFINIIPAPTTP